MPHDKNFDNQLSGAYFLAATLIAVTLGIFVRWQAGVENWSSLTNLLACAIGYSVFLLAGKGRWKSFNFHLASIILFLLITSVPFFGADSMGVRRWYSILGIYLNANFLLMPILLMSLINLDIEANRKTKVLLSVLTVVSLILQPDASQATAFGAAMSIHFLKELRRDVASILFSASVFTLVLVAWMQPDPLERVAGVEDILTLSWNHSVHLSIAAGIVLFFMSSLFVLVPDFNLHNAIKSPALELAIYFVVISAAPLIGAFPVPFLGHGASPILGYWLAVALVTHVGE